MGIITQIFLGKLTGFGEGSIGLLTFLLLVEVDPRFRFKYAIPYIRDRRENLEDEGE